MERNFPFDNDIDLEKSFPALGKKIQRGGRISVKSVMKGSLAPFGNLMKLQAFLVQESPHGEPRSRYPKPLDIEQLEMLEAELQNQNILPKLSDSCLSLAQHALHEKNIWRWCARRYGFNSLNIRFVIDIAKYIIRCGEEILSISTDEVEVTLHGPTSEYRKSVEQIQYLDTFADYLTGSMENNQNRYQRGLNLLLKTLAYSPPFQKTPPHLVVCLPIEKKDFLKLLREIGER